MSVPDVSGAAIANLEVETLQHKFPTFHGDTIHAETRVLDVQPSKSKPDRGIVTVESKGFNQHGQEVCYFRRRVMVWKRDSAALASPPVRRRRRLGRPEHGGVLHARPGGDKHSTEVLQWGMPRLRDLPWRRTRDPWAILVSEVMLQQTQALRVIPKWHAFMAAFPTPAACAEASLGDVLRLWQGLGYPRRASNLHAAATQIAALGRVPLDTRGAARPAGRRQLHGARRAGVRVRGRRRGRRHQHRPCAGPCGRPSPHRRSRCRSRPTRRCRPASRGRGTSA